MKSWSCFVVGLFIAVLAAGAHALGVGEIELNSHLNQRLAAEIPLNGADGMRAEEIIVSLGNSEDFERAGVERFFYLTDLRFEVFVDGRGPRVRVTSRQPVTEPYLNFIVEVLWPNGRMLKEFTLLLDPPTYEAAVSRPASGSSGSPLTQPAPATQQDSEVGEAALGTAEPAAPPSTYSRPASAAPPSAPEDGVMTDGQTLWGIAERYNPDDSVTVNQYMLAIQRRNPDAFIRQNINLMKGGVRLQMPDADTAQEISAVEAADEVGRQREAWRGGEKPSAVADAEVSGVAGGDLAPELRTQIDTTEAAATEESPDDEPQAAQADGGVTGRLEIVGDTGDSGNAQSPAANADVDALQEENARLVREVQELGYQSDREKEIASSEIAVKERQLEVKDQQLAELRRQLEEVKAELASRSGEPSQDQNQSAQPWWQSTPVLVAAGLFLVLALAGGLLLARRRAASRTGADTTATGYREADSVVANSPVIGAVGASVVKGATGAAAVVATQARTPEDDVLDLLDEDAAHSEPELKSSEQDDLDRSSPAMQTSDVISEADIYAAYGRYPHAIGLLLGALEDDPDRHDVRLKLLEVAVSASDAETFEKHIQQLVDRCDDQDILLAARELEESFTGGVAERLPEAGDEASAQAASTVRSQGGDLDLDEDDLTADPVDRPLDEEFLLELDDDQDPQTATSHTSIAADVAGDVAVKSVPAGQQTHGPYEAVATIDTPDESRADVLGGDLGIDFDDADLDEAELIEDAPRSNQAGSVDQDDPSFDDELGIDDLLADLDEPAQVPPLAAGMNQQDIRREEDQQREGGKREGWKTEGWETEGQQFPDGGNEVRFTRAGADQDVPLLDEEDALTDDDLLAGDEPGIEDLDDLLADLDEVEERAAVSDPVADPRKKSAEILSFSRPRSGSSTARDEALIGDDDAAEDDGFDFGSAEDAADTKLDLARAYIEMGDSEGAQDILGEVLAEGTPAQRQAAQSLLDNLAS